MHIKELDSFKLSDAVVFHDHLNPNLWRNQHLRPEVKDQLMIIAEDFLQELGISGLRVEDITVSGSNAAYSYTPHSDLDLHILVDMSNLPNDEVYRELFNAKKNLYNDTHDIKVHGVPVELYVQDASLPVVSLGEYSIKNDKWLRIPVKRRANFDQNASVAKYEKMANLIELGLKSRDIEKVDHLLKTIKRYRQAGLDKGGEFGPENLAFKALRSQGYIDQLYQLRNELHSERLSIEEDDPMRFAAERTPEVNPYGGLRDTQFRGDIAEASGYIPSEKEKNDPRFKTALTVDVRPTTMKTDAKRFGNKISRAGIPPTANANGKF